MVKVLTVKQPWATLIVEGIKKYEFRSWKTKYRGEVLIHAGLSEEKEEIKKFESLNLNFPKGKIIGIVNIVDCLLLDDSLNKQIISSHNVAYGNKYRTGYAWKLDGARKIKLDKEVKGKLGLWNLDSKDIDLQ